jgi:hypothetical protein
MSSLRRPDPLGGATAPPSGVQPGPLAEGRPRSMVQGVRAQLAAGERRALGRLPPPLAAGEPGKEASPGPPISGAKAPGPRLLGAKTSPGSSLSGAEASPTLRYASRNKRWLSPLPPPRVRGTGSPKQRPKDLDPPIRFDRWCGVAGQGAPRPGESVGCATRRHGEGSHRAGRTDPASPLPP